MKYLRDEVLMQKKNSHKKIDVCSICIGSVLQNYIDTRGTRPLMSECDCDKGKRRVVDEEKTHAMATCGENRTQHKWVDCKKCMF